MTQKKSRVKNPNYRRFLDEGIIEPITEEQLTHALKNCTGIRKQHIAEGRAILIALYYTGARPNEALQLKPKDFGRKASYVTIKLKGSKGGLPRTLYFPHRKKYIKELYNYAMSLYPDVLMFYHYRTNYVRQTIGKDGKIHKRIDISNKLNKHIKKWFAGVVPDSIPQYFLRHNRFSKLAQKGLSDRDLRMMKGSRTTESVTPYIHMSEESAQNIARKIE